MSPVPIILLHHQSSPAIMASKQTIYLAGTLGEASFQDPNSATTSGNSLKDVSNSQPSQATLLGLPQELRDKIFANVYATPDMTGDRVSLTVCAFSSGAKIPLLQAPPSKLPILVCRQLYTEMRNMQAAAFRQYWSNTTFEVLVSQNPFHPAVVSYTVADSDLEHAGHFVIHASCQDVEVVVDCHFQDGKWAACFDVSGELWEAVCKYKGWALSQHIPEGRQRLVYFDSHMRMSSGDIFAHETRVIDPTLGSAFSALDVCNAVSFAEKLILYGPYPGWHAA